MITVLGSSGFIGRHLVKKLAELNLTFLDPARRDPISHIPLGHIIYCVGLTADFRRRPLEAVEAHVCKLLEILHDCQFDSLLYLSSTRVYGTHLPIAREDEPLQVSPLEREDLYNISKIMGESVLVSSDRNVRIARLSNVYGPDYTSDNFLSSIIKEALSNGRIVLRTSPASERDYLSIGDAVDGIIKIATGGRHKIYNLASGKNSANQALADRIAQLTGCEVEYAADAAAVKYPLIGIERMEDEFSFRPADVLGDLERTIDLYKRNQESWDDQN
jgi:nucleoside-diphosphate-sugar epimerase